MSCTSVCVCVHLKVDAGLIEGLREHVKGLHNVLASRLCHLDSVAVCSGIQFAWIDWVCASVPP